MTARCSPAPWVNEDGLIYSQPLDRVEMITLDGETEARRHHTGLVALVYGHHVGEDHHYTHDDNARLIAAGPDMRQALHKVAGAAAIVNPTTGLAECLFCTALEGTHEPDCAMWFVLAAVAKAGGL